MNRNLVFMNAPLFNFHPDDFTSYIEGFEKYRLNTVP